MGRRDERKVTDSMRSRFDVLYDSKDRDGNNNGESNPTNSGNLKVKGIAIYNNPLGGDETDSFPVNGQNLMANLLPICMIDSGLKAG